MLKDIINQNIVYTSQRGKHQVVQ